MVAAVLSQTAQAALRRLQWVTRRILWPAEASMKAAFRAAGSPFHHLGALTIYFFWIVLVSGIYLYVFYQTSVHGAYASVAHLTRDQWYLGGIMRSLHRYASDAAVATLGLHVVRGFARDRYRGSRWFSWITGVPTLWLVAILGITGYWLVWDRLAQYLAVVTTELLDQLPVFAAPIARNFLTPESVSDRFFTLLAFLHFLSLPILLAGSVFLHVQRLNRPAIHPTRALAIGALLTLLALAALSPAHSQGPADLSTAPTALHFDWFYLSLYALANHGPPGLVWGLLFGMTLLLCVLPWLPPAKRAPVAVVTPAECSGCGQCVADCPYNAITLVVRPAGDRADRKIAVVDPDLCAACGICAGACPSSTPFRHVDELVTGIDLPDFTVDHIKTAAEQQLAALAAPARIMLFGCRYGVDAEGLRLSGIAAVTLPCSAMLPPSFIEYLLRRRHADGVVITGCAAGDCHYRFGNRWMEERLAGLRVPYLRASVSPDRVQVVWAAAGESGRLKAEIEQFRSRLASIVDTPRQPEVAAVAAAATRAGRFDSLVPRSTDWDALVRAEEKSPDVRPALDLRFSDQGGRSLGHSPPEEVN